MKYEREYAAVVDESIKIKPTVERVLGANTWYGTAVIQGRVLIDGEEYTFYQNVEVILEKVSR